MRRVHFACNDDRGNCSGFVDIVEFFDTDGGLLLRISTSLGEESTPIEWSDELLIVGGAAGVGVGYAKHHSHVGNIYWDSCHMSELDAQRLAQYLGTREDWTADEWIEEEPWKTIAETSLSR